MEIKISNCKFAALLKKTCCALIYQQMYYFSGFFPTIRDELYRRPDFLHLLRLLVRRQHAAAPEEPGALAAELCAVPSRGSCAFRLVEQARELMVASAVEAAALPTLCARGNVLHVFFSFFFLLFFFFPPS